RSSFFRPYTPWCRRECARFHPRFTRMIPRANTMTRSSSPHQAYIGSTLILATATLVAQAAVEVVTVSSKAVQRQIKLPGEFQPYLAVPIFAKVTGFVKAVNVDRGSAVKQGQVLATLEAPEMISQVAEAQSKAQALELQRAEAEAKLASARSTYDRLKA